MTRGIVATVFGIALLADAAGAQPAKAAPPDGQKLMQAIENRPDGKDQTSKVTLEIIPKKGDTRVRAFTLMRKEFKDQTKLVTFFSSPADVRDSAFLVVDEHGKPDRRSIYLPYVGQVRKLTSSEDRKSFFNSDFVNEDLTNRDPELDTHTFAATGKVGEWDCWVVDSKPKNTRGLDFVSYRTWIWKDDPIVIRQEFYDKAGKNVRSGNVLKLQKIQNIWTVQQASVKNHNTGSTTVMKVKDVKYNNGLADTRFTEDQLSRGAP